MSVGFSDMRDNTAGLPGGGSPFARAVVLEAPASSAHLVKVQAVDDASGGRLYLGEAPWPKPAGKELPGAGDECLVAFDETRAPWVVAWAVPGW
jgi:hypothetical protein